MRIAEYVSGEVLVLEVASRSRGREVLHHLALRLKEDGQVVEVSCSCEGFSYRAACHHLRSLRDIAGALVRRKGGMNHERFQARRKAEEERRQVEKVTFEL